MGSTLSAIEPVPKTRLFVRHGQEIIATVALFAYLSLARLPHVITHVVVFSFRDGTSTDAIRAFMEDIAHFPERFPAMRGWRLGVNESDSDRTYTHAFVVEFDSHEELRAYMDSETHKVFLRDHWRPIVASRAIVSFEHDRGVTPPVS